MALQGYGVLKGRPVDRRLGMGQNPHYQIKVVAAQETLRIAVNVRSQQNPSELLYLVDDRFSHPICDRIAELEVGFHRLGAGALEGGLDFICGLPARLRCARPSLRCRAPPRWPPSAIVAA